MNHLAWEQMTGSIIVIFTSIFYIFLYYNEMSKPGNMSGHVAQLANPYALDTIALFF